MSGLAGEWEDGSPRVLAGLSGTELVRDAYDLTGENVERAKFPGHYGNRIGSGRHLKQRRQLRGWSQTDLAVRSGVNVRNIRQYEQNP